MVSSPRSWYHLLAGSLEVPYGPPVIVPVGPIPLGRAVLPPDLGGSLIKFQARPCMNYMFSVACLAQVGPKGPTSRSEHKLPRLRRYDKKACLPFIFIGPLLGREPDLPFWPGFPKYGFISLVLFEGLYYLGPCIGCVLLYLY